MKSTCHSMPPLVCVVDDEDLPRKFVQDLLELHGFSVRSFSSAEQLLAEHDESATDCIVTDLRMPGIDGLQLQQCLRASGTIVSVVVLSGAADVPTAVRLMENGAITLLQKPFKSADLVSAVRRSVQITQERRKTHNKLCTLQQSLEQLTDEERAVLDCILSGLTNKATALKLALSMRTLNRRRLAVFTKMAVQSSTELATLMAGLR
jgi:two-component system response regulator FixJ